MIKQLIQDFGRAKSKLNFPHEHHWPFRRNFRFVHLWSVLHRRYLNLANKQFQWYKPTTLQPDGKNTAFHGSKKDCKYHRATWQSLTRIKFKSRRNYSLLSCMIIYVTGAYAGLLSQMTQQLRGGMGGNPLLLFIALIRKT